MKIGYYYIALKNKRKVYKMNFKRILAIILAALTCLSLFCACNDNGNEENSEETTSKEEVERFDYFAANMSDYVALDSSKYKGSTITLDTAYQVTEKMVTDTLNSMLYKYRSPLNGGETLTDKAIEFGDTAFIYYRGEIDGKEFSGGSNFNDKKPHELGIGSDSFIEGFEDGLIGIVPSETSKENPYPLKVTFPENYKEDLAGKDAIFYVWVVEMVDYELPELTNDFVTKTLKFKTDEEDAAKALIDYIREGLEKNRDNVVKNDLWEKLLDEAVVIKYPETEVQYFYDSYMEQYEYSKKQYEAYGYKFASFDDFVIKYLGLETGADWKAETREQSEIDVLQNLLCHLIAQQENIEVTEEDYKAAVDYYMEYYKSYGQTITEEELVKAVGERLLNEYALFEKVNEFLLENCTVDYKDKE